MRIQEILSEVSGIGQSFKSGMGMNTQKSIGSNVLSIAGAGLAKAAGLNNVATGIQQKAGVGAYANNPLEMGQIQNPQELVKILGFKQGATFQLNPQQKVKIDKIDQHGVHFMDPKTGMPTTYGADALNKMYQQQQLVQAQQQAQQAQKNLTQPKTKQPAPAGQV